MHVYALETGLLCIIWAVSLGIYQYKKYFGSQL